ncbi:MAG: extracellular solute-binding protein [Bacilli bacterium]|nr:extracellular solute-binding protein [Bacilli bacterium]
MKKSLLLFILVFAALVFASCKNVRKPTDFNVLNIADIENLETNITFKVRQGVISDALVDLVDEFQKEYPYIKVKVATVSGNYDLLRSSTILDINSKNKDNIPDLIIGYPDHFAEYYGGSNLVNLQYFIDDPDVGMDEAEMADFIQAYLPENRGFNASFPNDLYGLPFNKSTEVMVYNKTAFEALFGENYLDKVPSTWEEMKTVGAEIVTKVKAGELDNTFIDTYDPDTKVTTYMKISDYLSNPENVQFVPFGYDSSDNGFITLTRQFGAKYTERESVLKGYIYFDNAEARSAMTYFQNMRNDGLFATAAVFGAQYNSDALKAIQVLMTVGSSAGVGYNASTKYELGFAPIPYYNEDAKYVIQQGTNIGMLSHNTDEEKLASWLFIKFLMRPENTAQFAMATGGYLPVKESAYETDEYSEYLENPTDDKKEFAAAAKVALYDYIEKEYKFFVDDAFIGSSKVREEAGRIFDSVIVNKENVADRFKAAYRTLSPYVPSN